MTASMPQPAETTPHTPRIDPRPELVFFDIGDTLLRVDPSWTGAYLAAATSWGLQVDAAALARAFAQALGEGLWDAPGPFEATPEGSYQRIKQFDVRAMALLGYPDLPDAFYRHLGRFFERRAAWYVFPDVVPALEALLAAGVRRAVISNWVWALPELLHDLDLSHYFEVIVASARVGYVKPQRQIFDHALEMAGVRPEQAIHVGDSTEADVAGASAAGIRPVLLDRAGRYPSGYLDGLEVPVVHDLFGLLDALGVRGTRGAPSAAQEGEASAAGHPATGTRTPPEPTKER
jgi:putative hydrolase of the HAD superfamily